MNADDEESADGLTSFVWSGFDEADLGISDFRVPDILDEAQPPMDAGKRIQSVDDIEEFVPQCVRLEREKSALRHELDFFVSNYNTSSLILFLSNSGQGQDGVIRAVCEQFGQLNCFVPEFVELGVVFVSFTDFAAAQAARDIIDRDYSLKYGVRASFCCYLPPAFTSQDLSDPFSLVIEFASMSILAPTHLKIEMDVNFLAAVRMCIGESLVRCASVAVGHLNDAEEEEEEMNHSSNNLIQLKLSFYSHHDCQLSQYMYNQFAGHHQVPVCLAHLQLLILTMLLSFSSPPSSTAARQAMITIGMNSTLSKLKSLLHEKRNGKMKKTSNKQQSSLLQLFDSRQSSSITDEDDNEADHSSEFVDLNLWHTSMPHQVNSGLFVYDPLPSRRLMTTSMSARSLISPSLSSHDVDYLIDVTKIGQLIDTRTSIMIRNIPNKYTQHMLLGELNDAGLSGKFDFFYIPIDFKNRCNIGYAFMNMINFADIVFIFSQLSNKKWKSFNSDKVCSISYAKIQGKAALVSRFQNSTLMDKEDSFKPLIFYSSGPLVGQLEPFPLPSRSHLTNSRSQMFAKRVFLSCDETQWS